MNIYIYRIDAMVYVVEGNSHEEAIIKIFNMTRGEHQLVFSHRPDVTQCPTNMASTAEARELLYDR